MIELEGVHVFNVELGCLGVGLWGIVPVVEDFFDVVVGVLVREGLFGGDLLGLKGSFLLFAFFFTETCFFFLLAEKFLFAL